jgi:Na+/H+ antiporter
MAIAATAVRGRQGSRAKANMFDDGTETLRAGLSSIGGWANPPWKTLTMHTFELLLLLVTASVVLAYVADRLHVPLAVALVFGGIALAFVPGIGTVELEPELALALFLPPLLQASAYRTDWQAFRLNLRPILLLAVGAVFFTAAAVAVVAKLLVPELPWWAAIALGAIVAPPDAVAAAAVLKQVKLPKRIVTVLEGESLINDASSLVLYRFAVAATLAGSFSIGHGVLQFFGAALGGALVGWAVGRATMWVLEKTQETLLDITVTLLSGFLAYWLAEQIHSSGVLAAVVLGMLLGRQQHAAFSAQTRLNVAAIWEFVEFLLTALVFMLIGLQLRGIVERLERFDGTMLALLGVAISITLIVSRFVWVFPSIWLPRLLFASVRESDPLPPWSHATLLSWAGMRGVVSLAAALALPAAFPGRDIIVFLAFCAIFATLVVQGTTLGWVIRRLRLHEAEPDSTLDSDTAQARAELAEASLEAVREHLEDDESEHSEAAAELVGEYETQAERLNVEANDPEAKAEKLHAQRRLRLVAIEAARAQHEAKSDEMDAETHRAIGRDLDLEEQRIRHLLGET